MRDEVFWRQDGTSFPVQYTTTPTKHDHRELGAVVTFMDMTEQREIERIKDEFTSMVNHELRTPLTSIMAVLGLLGKGALGSLTAKGRRMLDVAVANTDRLMRLINDFLDIDRMASGTIVIQSQLCDAADLVNEAADEMRPMADAVGQTLSVDAQSLAVLVDSDRILQTLTNLISNGIKFSPTGGSITVSVELEGEEILFRVTDEGRGIPADELESIFERFHQVDASDSRTKGGTGLGLAICRTIVEQHGGRIWAESSLGRGTTFSFTLPRPLPNDRAKNPWNLANGRSVARR